MRGLLWRFLWGLAFRIWSPGFRSSGAVPEGPVLFAANHSSHADTAAIQLALARSGHTRVLAAGAEDYFFRNRLFSMFSRFVGVFPFPRSGREGVDRAVALLDAGTSVLVFPQGTRNGGPFRRGIADIAEPGWPVVPITITGTREVLPKGVHWPRRGSVSISFGRPIKRGAHETPEDFTARIEAAVMRKKPAALAA